MTNHTVSNAVGAFDDSLIPQAWQDRARELYPEAMEVFTLEGVEHTFDGNKEERAAYLRGLSECKWISVKDSLPEDQQIIDTWNGKANRRAKYSPRSTPCKFRRHVDITEGDRLMLPYYPDVTHWQPLPEPPSK